MQGNLNIINARVNMAWCERKQGGNGGRVEEGREGRGREGGGLTWYGLVYVYQWRQAVVLLYYRGLC